MKRNLTFFKIVSLMLCSTMFSCGVEDYFYDTSLEPTAKITLALTAPADGAEGVSDLPTFEWTSEVTPVDIEDVIYDIYVGTTADNMKAFLIDNTGLSCTSTRGLQMGQEYYWKVVATATGESYESETQKFTVRTMEAATLQAPADEAIVYDDLTFEWDQVATADGEIFTYTVYAKEIGNPTADLIKVGSVENAAELAVEDASIFKNGKSYSWYLTVTSGDNISNSEERSFTKLQEGAPTIPELIAPTSMEAINGGSVTFEWSACEPSNSANSVSYDLYCKIGDADFTKVQGGITETTYTYDISAADSRTIYDWKVVAVENGVESESDASRFYKIISVKITSPSSSVLPLGDKIEWADLGGSYKYSVKLNGSTIASNLTTTSYAIKNSQMSCDLKNPKFFDLEVVATSTTGGSTVTSPAVTFQPQMKGTFTDARDNKEYGWVRIGTQIWMTQDLKATTLTDGTELVKLEEGATFSTTFTENTANYAEMPDNYYDLMPNPTAVPVVADFKTAIPFDEFKEIAGYVYPSNTAQTGKLAPEGWRCTSKSDIETLLKYIGAGTNFSSYLRNTPYSSQLMSSKFGGSDDYGLSMNVNVMRNGTDLNYGNKGWVNAYWDNHGIYLVPNSADARFFALGHDKDAGQKGWIIEYRNWGFNMMMAVRCVLNE